MRSSQVIAQEEKSPQNTLQNFQFWEKILQKKKKKAHTIGST